MNQAASHPASRMALPGVIQNGRFLIEGCGRQVISKRKERIMFRSDPILWGQRTGGGEGYVYQAPKQAPLVLIWTFSTDWFKIYPWEKLKLQLGYLLFWFGERAQQVTPFCRFLSFPSPSLPLSLSSF